MSETGVTLELRREVDRLLADNEAKAREIEYFKVEYQDTAGITQIKTERDFLVADIARLKSRPTSEEVEEMIQRLDAARDEYVEHKIIDLADIADAASFLRRLLARGGDGPEAGTAAPPADRTLDKEEHMDCYQYGTVDGPASDPDAVARAKQVWTLAHFDDEQSSIEVIASALAAAEKRGAEREREACAQIAYDWNGDMHYARPTTEAGTAVLPADNITAEQAWENYQERAPKAAGARVKWVARPAFMAGWRSARSQPDERGG